MELADLLKICGPQGPAIRDDSREIGKGDIFVAVPGESDDGARHIPEAIRRGAAYVVCAPGARESCGGADAEFVECGDIRGALGSLASAKWRSKDSGLKFVAVTGTNGKTSSAGMLEAALSGMGHKCGVLGTIKYKWPGHEEAAPLTTPGVLRLHEMAAKMREAGADFCVMEASSHALAQRRVAEIEFDGALFTNLTQDHLDFHKDMEAYFRAKAQLFLDLPRKGKAMAINGDDPYGRRLLELLPDAVSYGLSKGFFKGRQLIGEILSAGREGLSLKMAYEGQSWELNSPLIGEFNAMNLLGVQALALGLGAEIQDLMALEGFQGVPGRLERINNPLGKHVFVDYAHTPDALANALRALRKADFKRIITVFGCGGDRDRSKRPLMAAAVAEHSDVAILTSDNPRTEDPLRIIADALPGLGSARESHTEPDRRKATALGLELLRPGDALLIAGKGHEDYQIIGKERRHYSDQEVARELLGCA